MSPRTTNALSVRARDGVDLAGNGGGRRVAIGAGQAYDRVACVGERLGDAADTTFVPPTM